MPISDYNEVIQRVLKDEIHDAVFKKTIEALKMLFPTEGTVGGDLITKKFEVARTSPAAAYDKSDVDPAGASNTLVKPYWTKVQYHTACEIPGIDISNAKNGGTDVDLVQREIQKETASLWDIIFSAMMTQLKADVDSAATYSDKALSRSTYPAIASYEEATNAAITLAYMRGMIYNTMVNKSCGPLSGYVCLMEHAVYNVLQPLAAALHTWNAENKGMPVEMGWPEMGIFEGLKILHPSEIPGMTTGDVLMLRRQDVLFNYHRPLEIVQVPSGRDSYKFVIRLGINIHVINPGFQGKMTDKD